MSNFKPAQSPSINQLSSDDALLFIKFDSVFFFQLLFFRPPAELRLPAYGHGAGAEWRPAGRVPHGHTLAVCAASGLPGNGHTVPVDSDENGEKFFLSIVGNLIFNGELILVNRSVLQDFCTFVSGNWPRWHHTTKMSTLSGQTTRPRA